MKIAILADIHSNWPALQRLNEDLQAWKPDRVFVAGDIINRGPRPLQCLLFVQDKVREEGWQVVRGNHEDYVIHQARRLPPWEGPEAEIFQNSRWTYQRLNGQLDWLEAMPFQITFDVHRENELRVVHASMRHNRDGIYVESTDEELRQKIAPAPEVFCVGHTHQPLIRQIDHTLVVNAGSVGAPFDRDPRAGYARLTYASSRWRAEIIRLAYDYEEAERDYHEAGFIDSAGDLARIMLFEFQHSRPFLHDWVRRFERPVLNGYISLSTSVDLYLADLKEEFSAPLQAVL